MKRPRHHLFAIAVLGYALPLLFAACGTTEGGPPVGVDAAAADTFSPPPPPVRDGAIADVVPPIACSVDELPEGKGKVFCDLPGPDATDVQVPPDFCVREYTQTRIAEARVLRFAPNGDLFVSAPSMSTAGGALGGPGAIFALPDDDGDGRADSVLTYAGPYPTDGRNCDTLEGDPKNLSCVHGLLFDAGYLYLTRSDEVRRYPYAIGDRVAPAAGSELVAKLGGDVIPDVRWTHTLERTKEGTIYVSRGRADSKACSQEEMARGAVLSLRVGQTTPLPVTPGVVADGFRNPMYLRCSPSSCGDCYASELSGDDWIGVGGREKLALLPKSNEKESWGFPCCVGRDQPHPAWPTANCANVGKELVSIPLHDTNFGLDFDRGGFPPPYRHGLFVALHGVFTSFGGTGVVFVPTDPVTKRPSSTTPSTSFAKGFLPNGRATDVAFAPDGRLFVADDTAGKIYWIAPRTLRAAR